MQWNNLKSNSGVWTMNGNRLFGVCSAILPLCCCWWSQSIWYVCRLLFYLWGQFFWLHFHVCIILLLLFWLVFLCVFIQNDFCWLIVQSYDSVKRKILMRQTNNDIRKLPAEYNGNEINSLAFAIDFPYNNQV